jgi:S1-C subfamily serine protease
MAAKMKPETNQNQQITEATESSERGPRTNVGLRERTARISRRARSVNRRTVLLGSALVVSAAAGFGGGLVAQHTDNATSVSLSDQKKIVTSQGELISSISKSVGPSVVSITTSTTAQTTDFFGNSRDNTQQAAGTGMIITKSGIILTNRHVVPAGTTSVSVTLADGTTFDDVEVLGRTSTSDSLDVAFLKIKDLKGKSLQAVQIGNSSQTNVGDAVVAIGNALGQFQNTVTSGIISGFGRQVVASSGGGSFFASEESEDLDNLIQTDAAINEGNSGGPLVNMNAQVVGINTAIASDAQNIGFAIPINDVKGLIDQVVRTGKFERPYLGVRYVLLNEDVAKSYGIAETNGAYIIPEAVSGQDSVVSGSPADKAGLRGGDVITKINGTSVNSTQSLTTLLNQHQPGDEVTLSVVRDGKTQNIKATLGSTPGS